MDDIDELEKELDAPNDNEWNETRFQRRMDTVANASANLGKLLLQGWTMLADECEKCHTPLMSLRDAPPTCVLCNKPHEKTVPSTQKRNDIDELNALNDKLWNDEAFEKRIQKSEDASAKIGELLLKGWTMLAEHCQKCQTPLMSLRGGKSMCCICSASDTQITTLPPQKPKQPKPPTPHKINPAEMNGVAVDRHDVHGPPPFFGFGPRQDQQLRRTVGDVVKTVLDKMSTINERMRTSNHNLRNELQELNELMEFLQNVKNFKKQLME